MCKQRGFGRARRCLMADVEEKRQPRLRETLLWREEAPLQRLRAGSSDRRKQPQRYRFNIPPASAAYVSSIHAAVHP